VGAEVAEKPSSRDRDDNQQPYQRRSVARPVIPSELDDEDERR
jgi:hypothetical protein